LATNESLAAGPSATRLRLRLKPAGLARHVVLLAFVGLALVPIYFGRVGSFVIENRHQTTDQAEERVERQAREFELLKPYLVQRWNAVEVPA